MNPAPTKRGAPAVARALLQRVSSKTDVKSTDDTDQREPNTPTSPSTLSQAMSHAQLSSQGSGSIEQSVRMFRLFEALRAGDTAAIAKVITEASTARTEGEPRQSSSSYTGSATAALEGTSILHLAIQCADPSTIEYILSHSGGSLDVNARDKDGNTPLHIASMLSRAPVVRMLLEQRGINDATANYQGRTALDLAKNPEVFQQLQLARSMYVDSHTKEIQRLVAAGDYERLERLLTDSHFKSVIDVNGGELTTDHETMETGGTLLHEAARKKDSKLIQILLLNGADPFRRDRKGKLPQDVTKDDKTRALLKKSPAAAAAQRGIQEKTILGSGSPQAATGPITGENALGGKEGREMKGYLKKWVNYTTGYKLRWFVLEDGVLSYYKQQDDAGSACRGAINMKIATLHMDAQDKLRFEIIGKSSVKYHLKANHQVEAKRWFWALNNAIQYCKDEAKALAKSQNRSTELLRQAKVAEVERKYTKETDKTSLPGSAGGLSRVATFPSGDLQDDEDGATSLYETSITGDDMLRAVDRHSTTVIEGDQDDEDDYGDDASEIDAHPVSKDAFMTTAHAARLHLDLLTQISTALQNEKSRNPNVTISQPNIVQALASYESAVGGLNSLIGNLSRIARDREAYWQYRLEQEVNVRRLWEENMLKIAQEQEALENRIGESEEKRKRTKRALRDALENHVAADDVDQEDTAKLPESVDESAQDWPSAKSRSFSVGRRKSTYQEMTDIAASASDDEDDEEFFDAVGAGEVEVVEKLPPEVEEIPPVVDETPPMVEIPPPTHKEAEPTEMKLPVSKRAGIEKSYAGYEDPLRTRLKMAADDRPKISLWGILKSMIGKDMTKMTLPVSFNEPTSLLQRVAEDMEFTDLLDTAATRSDSTERMVYVAAFAASEYASTIGRVAKPFNPLLGETYEYVRPDKGYRFFIEQVSHHPPVGAAWAESAKWEYYGESAVKSKFYGKSFDINPLGTWFLKLRPSPLKGTEELYTWKKVTSSVVGIITGSPSVDNYGLMEVRNHTTGDVCTLDFKQRGWKASSAFQVTGKVVGRDGNTRWSIGGRWNDKIYARLTPGYQDALESSGSKSKDANPNKAFLVWETHPRPSNIPFNLTPFGVTLNALQPALRPHLPITDTRLRPDQTAMENGEYDLAASEKTRLEEKQRATRRQREQDGVEFEPKWFKKVMHPQLKEEYWVAIGSAEDKGAADGDGVEYWKCRANKDWRKCEDIF